jgi:cbb3-type cytochrome oxidase subunit 3
MQMAGLPIDAAEFVPHRGGREPGSPFMATLIEYWWLFAIPAAFFAILIYVFNPKRKRRLEANAEIPFKGAGERERKDR